MKIEQATPVHVPEMKILWKEFIDFHKEIDPFFSRTEDGHETFGRFVENCMKSDDFKILVAVETGHVVAYAIARKMKHPPVFRDAEYGLIIDMAVKAGYRRRGIGESLLSELQQWFESRNIRRIELNVVPRNRIGYSFWKKHGFRDYVHVLYLDRSDCT